MMSRSLAVLFEIENPEKSMFRVTETIFLAISACSLACDLPCRSCMNSAFIGPMLKANLPGARYVNRDRQQTQQNCKSDDAVSCDGVWV